MALKAEIQKSKNVSLWKEYKDAEGNVLAEFKIRGEAYKPYRVALERAQNQVYQKGMLFQWLVQKISSITNFYLKQQHVI